MRWRWLEHLVAGTLGYFWLPCPLCGEMFSGREIGSDSDTWGSVWEYAGENGRTGKTLCPSCTDAGLRVSRWALNGRSVTFCTDDERYEMPSR